VPYKKIIFCCLLRLRCGGDALCVLFDYKLFVEDSNINEPGKTNQKKYILFQVGDLQHDLNMA
jgi:hypothetical protein